MWTEFVSANGLCSPGREVLKRDLEYTEIERPIVAQLFTAEPDKMREAAKLWREIGEVYTSLTDHRRILHKGQRFKVVGISNLEDWIACMKALGSEPYWEEIAIPCDFY
jgi:hypothetical protein